MDIRLTCVVYNEEDLLRIQKIADKILQLAEQEKWTLEDFAIAIQMILATLCEDLSKKERKLIYKQIESIIKMFKKSKE